MAMRNTLVLTAVAALVGACGYLSAYEEAVYDIEPVYCYQSLGQSVSGVECYKTPKHRDERRLVNYYGPHPSRYDRPEPPPPRVRSKPEPAENLKAEPAAGETSEVRAAPAAKAAEAAAATLVPDDRLP